MKKRPFVLIEVLIAIALLTLCAFPFISESIFTQKIMRGKFFELELEREAENTFYQILKEGFEFASIPNHTPKKVQLPSIKLALDGIGEKTYDASYTICQLAKKNHTSPYYKIHIEMTFNEQRGGNKPLEFKYEFVGKKVEKNL